MNAIHLTLKRRFAVIAYAIVILAFALFITALNQLKKVKEYNRLTNSAAIIADSKYALDSLESVVTSNLPKDIAFFKTGKSKMVEQFLQYNNDLAAQSNKISNSFYLSSNNLIKIKVFHIKREINKLNDLLSNYVKYINQKGFEQYGINGQINLLFENLLNTCKTEGLHSLSQKITTLKTLKDQFILEREPAIINKIKIENEDAKAIIILSGKSQKLALITKLQQLEELIVSLKDYDELIGITPNDGLLGQMRVTNQQISVNALELKALVYDEMSSATFWGYIWLTLVFGLFIIAVYILFYQFNKFIYNPLQKIISYLSELVIGKLPETIKFSHSDEIALMAENLNHVVEGLKSKAAFAIEIGKGKLDSHYQPLSDYDILGNALIEMEKSLQKADLEDQKYKTDERKRIWANEGIAKFNEILRMHNNDINKLADEIIQNLVKYLNATQGELFFYNDEDESNVHLELIAAYAFDRKKYIKMNIQLGEGIVGTAALEKERIFITDIPENYMSITSGLGDAQPKSILVVPLKLEDEVLGVVELASFNIFESNEIEFVEKIGETISSTITSVKINARTSKLLEQSQKQAEEMAEQEEEMRQNMEELRTTQEDFARREAEIQGFLNAIQLSTMVMVMDSTGKIIEVNDLMLKTLYSKEEDIVGRYHKEFTSLNKNTEDYDKFWDEIKLGKPKELIEKIRLSIGKDLYLKQSFTSVLDNKNAIIKVLCISTNITDSISSELIIEKRNAEIAKISQLLDTLNTAIDQSLIKCVYSSEGRIVEVNENFCKISGHSQNELVGKVSNIFLKEDEKSQFDKIWNEVIKNNPYTGTIKRSKPTGEDIWLMASFVPIVNQEGNVLQIIFLAHDVTERRLKFQLLEEANKEIERLKKDKSIE